MWAVSAPPGNRARINAKLPAGRSGSATAVAVTDAEAGTDVGVTDFEGVLDYDFGEVMVVSAPEGLKGGSRAVEPAAVAECNDSHDCSR